jgi:hypothetical protein
MKKEMGKNVLVQERISEKGTFKRNQKTSEFGRNHKSEKKARNLKMSERNQKRKSEKKVRNVRKEIRKASTWWRFCLMFHVHSYWRREKRLILVKS